MGFIVTARKYRPQRFDEVVGQEHITQTLKNALDSERVAHAYLFTGPRGVGKTTTARILAKALNCTNPKDSEPCNECEMCKSIQSSQLMDIIEIDAASNRGIDEVRSLRESVKYAPSKGKFKVYIIDEVHMLTKDSFNAFLKTLEEPPSHTVFIFATTDVHRVPITIISRCQRYDFRRIQVDIIKNLLSDIAKQEQISIDDKTLTLIAKKSDGGLRDAESYFDQASAFCGDKIDYDTVVRVFNFIDDEIYFNVSKAIVNKNFNEAFNIAETVYKNGWNFIDFLEGTIEHFRNLMVARISDSTESIEAAEIYKEQFKELSKHFTEADILRMTNFVNKTLSEMRFSQNHRLKAEMAMCHIIGLERTETITDLMKAIEKGAPLTVTSDAGNQPIDAQKKTEFGTNEKHVAEKPTAKKTPPSVKKRKASSNKKEDLFADAIIEQLGAEEIHTD